MDVGLVPVFVFLGDCRRLRMGWVMGACGEA